MLTEEEEIKLAGAMLLVEVIEQGVTEKNKTAELDESIQDIKNWIDSVWKTLTEEEKSQALDRYKKERNSGDIKSLPPI